MPVAVSNPGLNALQRLLVYDVQIDGEALNMTSSELNKVEVGNLEGSHEYATITTQLTKKSVTRFIDKPISFTYGRKSAPNDFYGYVVSIQPNQEYQQDTVYDISCLGITWPMQSGAPRFVTNSTVPDLFASIVLGYGVGAQVDINDFNWPALAQTSESDWEFINLLATRLGYAVYNYRGVVRMVDPIRILTTTPIYQRYIKGDEILDSSRALLAFEAQSQSLDLRDNIKPSFGFFDGDTVTVTQRGKKPYRLETGAPMRSREMAKVYDEAWSRRIDFWNNAATARISGDARVIPGVNVAVQVGPTLNIPNVYDGVWMVRGVQHALTHKSFQTQLTLARDTSRIPTNTQTEWFWNVPRGAPRIIMDMTSGKWKSSWANAAEYIGKVLL